MTYFDRLDYVMEQLRRFKDKNNPSKEESKEYFAVLCKQHRLVGDADVH